MFRLAVRKKSTLLLLASLVLSSAPFTGAAQSGGHSIWIPMREPAGKEIKLEATLYKPDGVGPFPVVIFNHGSTGREGAKSSATRTENPLSYGKLLAGRGVALLVPMRRGRGRSDGRYREEDFTCSRSGARAGIAYASESLDAVYEYLRKQPWADMKTVVLAGQSRGGMLSSLYASERPGSAVGVINFVGGWFGDSDRSYCLGGNINAALFEQAGGGKSKIPNLFLYGTGDSYYSNSSIQKYAPAFKEAGGDVNFKLYELSARTDGHLLFYHFFSRWGKDHEAFLSTLGIW